MSVQRKEGLVSHDLIISMQKILKNRKKKKKNDQSVVYFTPLLEFFLYCLLYISVSILCNKVRLGNQIGTTFMVLSSRMTFKLHPGMKTAF